MPKKIVENAEALNLSELKNMILAAENHNIPVMPAEGPCGGCDLVIKVPEKTAEGPCGGCDVLTPPKNQAEGPCGGCDLMKNM